MRSMFIMACFALALVLCAVAWGAGVPDPGQDPEGLFKLIGDTAGARQWVPMVALIVVAVIFLARRYLPLARWWPWLRTQSGGWVSNAVLSGIQAAAISVYEGLPAHQILLQAIYAGALAAGVYQGLKDRVAADKKLEKPADQGLPTP